MIEAKDLRLGNMVQFSEWDDEDAPNIFYVAEIQEDLIWLETNMVMNRCKQLQGIPLTEEWLTKFGFESVQELACALDEGIEGLGLNCLFYNDMGVSLLKDLHIHQLQNLFHSLTGEELTINQKEEV